MIIRVINSSQKSFEFLCWMPEQLKRGSLCNRVANTSSDRCINLPVKNSTPLRVELDPHCAHQLHSWEFVDTHLKNKHSYTRQILIQTTAPSTIIKKYCVFNTCAWTRRRRFIQQSWIALLGDLDELLTTIQWTHVMATLLVLLHMTVTSRFHQQEKKVRSSNVLPKQGSHLRIASTPADT